MSRFYGSRHSLSDRALADLLAQRDMDLTRTRFERDQALAKLAELEAQEPFAWVVIHEQAQDVRRVEFSLVKRSNVNSEPLYRRPMPRPAEPPPFPPTA